MQARGFTLIEMLTVVTISAILVAMAVPSFVWMNARTRAANASNSLLASFELARSEAIRRNVRVSVCRADLTDPVNPVCSAAVVNGIADNDWGSGWLVFAKMAATPNDFFDSGGGDVPLRVEQFIGPASTRAVVESSAAVQFYSFRGDGMSLGGTPANPLGITFAIDYRKPTDINVSGAGRCLVFNMTGRANSYAPVSGSPAASAC